MRRVMLADALVLVGRQCGVAVAESIYQSLSQEPEDSHGQRVDWETIRARIAPQSQGRRVATGTTPASDVVRPRRP